MTIDIESSRLWARLASERNWFGNCAATAAELDAAMRAKLAGRFDDASIAAVNELTAAEEATFGEKKYKRYVIKYISDFVLECSRPAIYAGLCLPHAATFDKLLLRDTICDMQGDFAAARRALAIGRKADFFVRLVEVYLSGHFPYDVDEDGQIIFL